jgi:hypothetical protein
MDSGTLDERLKEVINCNGSKVSQHDGERVEKSDQERPANRKHWVHVFRRRFRRISFLLSGPLDLREKIFSYSYSSSKSGIYIKLGSVLIQKLQPL